MKGLVTLVILTTVGLGCWATVRNSRVPASISPTSRKLAEVKFACHKHMKTRPACGCVAKNISLKVDRGQFNQEQLDDVVMAMKNLYFMGDIFQPRLESMADYLVGLEFHCQKNPKYSVN